MPGTAFFSRLVVHEYDDIPGTVQPSSDVGGGRYVVSDRLPPTKAGEDEYEIAVPDGQRYVCSTLITVPPTSRTAYARILQQPTTGATGSGVIKVAFFVAFFGAIRYRIRAYGEPVVSPDQGSETVEYEELTIENMQSVERLRSLIDSRCPIVVRFAGPDAEKIWGSGVLDVIGAPKRVAIADDIAIAAILAGAAVSIVAILAITAIVMYAVSKDYEITKVEFDGGAIGGNSIVELPVLRIQITPNR